MKSNQRKKDLVIKIITYLSSLVSVLILGSILVFVLVKGLPLLSIDIILGDNSNTASVSMRIDPVDKGNNFTYETKENEYFSKRYGVSFIDTYSLEGNKTITINYVDENSPFTKAIGKGNNSGEIFRLKSGDILSDVGLLLFGDDLIDNPNATNIIFDIREGASILVERLEETYYIANITPMILGGGIRGSIITTLYLIVLTLLIGLPIGIGSALYLHELAPKNKITNLLRSFIDMLTGVPSIIFGLMGAAFFIPLTVKLSGGRISGGNLISGALTLSVIILPVIIRATEAALDLVPKDYKLASLALGANETQTTFKVMLPNAIPGILSAALLGIGRIMGESAALIYAIGSVVKDDISIFGNGTSLSVHIWSAMSGERPNFALASTISIILLVIVLTLNLIVKYITYSLKKKYKWGITWIHLKLII